MSFCRYLASYLGEIGLKLEDLSSVKIISKEAKTTRLPLMNLSIELEPFHSATKRGKV